MTLGSLQVSMCRVHSKPYWHADIGAHFAFEEAAVAVGEPETNITLLYERKEFEERLYWGRQRGLAIIFAADAGPSDER